MASCLFAQSAGFGSISGVVQDATGAVVPNAKVVVENPSKGIRRDLDTNAGGGFTASALVPAPGYHVTVTAAGFSGYEIKDITVSVGETVTLTARLTVSSSSTAIEVTAEAPVIDDTKTDVSQVVTTRQIIELPINGRRVDSFVLLTPGVTTDGPFGLISFRGNPGGNIFLTDGNDTTNSFYDENAGRTRTTNISQDAVQEFQVVTSNFLAEYGHASGGVINTLTRSGSNELHGTAYWFFRNRTLNATDITAHGVNPPEWRHQAGVSIGGPIFKNKLFYFFNGELQRRFEPLVSSNLTSTNGLFDGNGNYIPVTPKGVTNCTASAAQCQAAVSYLQSRIDTQLVPRKADTNLLFGKIDFHPNERNAFSFSANYVDFRSPNGIQTQLSLADGSGIGNNADTNVFDRTARASWTFVATPAALNELRFGYFKDRQYDPASPSLLPPFGPVALTVNGISNVGYANGYPRLNPSEQRFQIADTLSLNVGKHSLKFGVDWDHVEDFVSRLANRYGTYTYSTLTAFALDFSGNTTGAKNYQRFQQAFGNPLVDVNMPEIGLFVQDQWHVTPKLTISPGVRLEHAWIPQPPISNPAFPQTGHIPGAGWNIGPRIGIAYALNQKTAFRAGYGIFYNRYTTSTIENLFLTNGVYQASYTLNSNVPAQIAAGPVFAAPLGAQPNVTGSSSIIFADSHWKNPYSEQLNVAIERELAKNTSLSVSYVWSRGIHLLTTRDANAAAPTTNYTYPILDATGNQTGSYTTPLYTQRINPAFGTIAEFDSGGNAYYNALIVHLTRRYSSWLQGSLGYTYSHSIDYNVGGGGNVLFGSTFPTSVFNGDYKGEKGSSSIDQRHRLVVNAIVSPTFTHSNSFAARYFVNNWQLSAVSVAASSQYLQPLVSVFNGAPGVLSTFSLNGLGGSSRVPFESIAALPIGNVYRTDARLAKQLPITERLKVYLMFEAFNVFNHVQVAGPSARVNTQYNAIKQTTGSLNGLIALVPNTSYGAILQTQLPPDGTSARRAQVAIRIVF
ncbi:MAG: TonB-dependent receptor [Acidobacteriota bacterium]|nr:TonB-dependent receptor [Acidobacteriota bacterium]